MRLLEAIPQARERWAAFGGLPVTTCVLQILALDGMLFRAPNWILVITGGLNVSQGSCRFRVYLHSLGGLGRFHSLYRLLCWGQDARLDGLPAWWDVDLKALLYLPSLNGFWYCNFFRGS